MSIRRLFVLSTVLLLGLSAWAQSDSPKLEVAADFSLVRFNPSSRFTSSHNIFGGGGSVTFNFGKFLGIKADLQGYGSQANTFIIPAGTVIGPTILTTPRLFTANGNLFTYLFGPQIKSHHGKIEPFGQVLVGGAHSNVYANLFQQVGLTVTNIGAAPSQNAFALLAGGGIDIKVTPHIAIRPVEAGYLLTRFSNNFSGTQNQNNFRYSAGIVFMSGSK